jgi:hypothetical protein
MLVTNLEPGCKRHDLLMLISALRESSLCAPDRDSINQHELREFQLVVCGEKQVRRGINFVDCRPLLSEDVVPKNFVERTRRGLKYGVPFIPGGTFELLLGSMARVVGFREASNSIEIVPRLTITGEFSDLQVSSGGCDMYIYNERSDRLEGPEQESVIVPLGGADVARQTARSGVAYPERIADRTLLCLRGRAWYGYAELDLCDFADEVSPFVRGS